MRWLALISVVGLVGCGLDNNRPQFDGQKFRAKLSKVDKKNGEFAVSVSPASRSLVGAREAGRFEGTKYCIKQFGTSDIVWLNGPDVEDSGLSISGDKLAFRGTCAP